MTKPTYDKGTLSYENIVAMKAVAQWVLGHREWGSTFVNLATADDPKAFAKSFFGEWPDEFETVWRQNGGS